ncbi:MAG: class I SAM-dependent methyltransferase [Chloroflexi bacterium]|uniref:Class I SAM-dependent methyltransferase n=1 Tax=Candidatus Chlorohelix allophototropha TaxID=3003348 RepID=A0A8T7M1N9_9CHLR|nr:class I SAM-dependent methyltransferase [Chloroflexota bacterium]WJW67860.1 class I SAM-dependent methyltransferase [Chloroflexota bacterium L227-S17]
MMAHTHETASKGNLVRWSKRYDAIFGHLLSGSEDRVIELAEIKTGATVLDLGCGPGSLTLKAKAHVGKTGKVFGIDAAPEMIELARKKAAEKGVEVGFQVSYAQELPFADATFDVVISRLVFHHLPGDLKRQALNEIQRVLKPGGRCLVVDFDLPSLPVVGGFLKHLLGSHAMPQTDVRNYAVLMKQADYQEVECDSTGRLLLAYAKGIKAQ